MWYLSTLPFGGHFVGPLLHGPKIDPQIPCENSSLNRWTNWLTWLNVLCSMACDIRSTVVLLKVVEAEPYKDIQLVFRFFKLSPNYLPHKSKKETFQMLPISINTTSILSKSCSGTSKGFLYKILRLWWNEWRNYSRPINSHLFLFMGLPFYEFLRIPYFWKYHLPFHHFHLTWQIYFILIWNIYVFVYAIMFINIIKRRYFNIKVHASLLYRKLTNYGFACYRNWFFSLSLGTLLLALN